VAADLNVEHPDELAIGHRHDRLAGAARERRGPFVMSTGGSAAILVRCRKVVKTAVPLPPSRQRVGPASAAPRVKIPPPCTPSSDGITQACPYRPDQELSPSASCPPGADRRTSPRQAKQAQEVILMVSSQHTRRPAAAMGRGASRTAMPSST
jgi:hypothetical protein